MPPRAILGIAPDALRQRNFIKPKAMPYTTATGKIYDSGDFAGHMARAQEMADWDGFNKRAARVASGRQAARHRHGDLYRGLRRYRTGNGDACGSTEDGGVTVLIGTQSTGQGHATAYAQLVAEQLGPAAGTRARRAGRYRRDRDRRRHRRLELDPVSAASRSTAPATKLAENSSSSPPTRWKPPPAISKSPTAPCASPAPTASISFADLAAQPRGDAGAADARRTTSAPSEPTYPNGTHIAEVEIDPDDRRDRRSSNYVVVDDFGVTLNPLLLAGQVHGGTVQGIGQALMEDTVYDACVRPIAQREPDGLRAAARRRCAGLRLRDPQRAVQDQSARREGRGRGRRHRFLPGGHERRRRCALARLSHPPYRHAGDAAADLGGDRGR